jgi:mono/diheme cytochrome c family protein
MRQIRRWVLMEGVVLIVLILLAVSNARAADAPTPARGQAAFTHRCGMCHREGGTGTFILARRLGTEKSLLEKRTDLNPDYIRTVVRWGLTNMPRISRVELPEPDMDALVSYLTAPKAVAKP